MNARAVLEAYEAEAGDLVEACESVSSAEIYVHVAHLFPQAPSLVADLGAGTGRDAAWLAAQGHEVLAVEPTAHFREAGAALHPSPRIEWLDDRLPELRRIRAREQRFDAITLCGVWHHLEDAERAVAMDRIAGLMVDDGVLILSLRHGVGSPTRPCYPSSAEATIALAEASGLECIFSQSAESVLPANRARGVTRTWLAFRKRA